MPALDHARTRCALLILALLAFPFAAGRWTQFSNFTDFTSVADDGDHIWIGTRGGLIRIGKASADTDYFNPMNSPLTDSRIRNKGGTAAVTYGGCLAVFEAGAWDGPEALAAMRGQSALDAAWDRPGSLWVLTSDQATGLHVATEQDVQLARGTRAASGELQRGRRRHVCIAHHL